MLTKQQNEIIVKAVEGKVSSFFVEVGAGVWPGMFAAAAAAHATMGHQISAAKQAGATFEDLLCLIYEIKGEEK